MKKIFAILSLISLFIIVFLSPIILHWVRGFYLSHDVDARDIEPAQIMISAIYFVVHGFVTVNLLVNAFEKEKK